MDEDFVANIFDPFTTTRTTRKVGLGLPFLKQSCNMAGRDATISSKLGVGTTLTAEFLIDSIDRVPFGDMAFTLASTLATHQHVEFEVSFKSDNGEFEVSTAQIKQALGEGIDLNQIDVIDWLNEYIGENEKKIFGGILDEIVS